MMSGEGGYRAGACNIGSREIGRRRAFGMAGLAAAVGTGAALLAVRAPRRARWLVALPLYGGLVGFLQARRRFCVDYAMRGRSNFGAPEDAAHVSSAEDRAADRRAAARLMAEAGATTVVATAAFVVLPL
jgi:hypothetical protein